MLTKLEVYGMRQFAPTLPLDDDGAAGGDPLQILDIDGLEPVKAAITTSPYGAFDGEAFVGASVGKRNIVLTIGLNPNWHTQTTAELRSLLYNYFMPKLPVQLRFESSHYPKCQIEGIVEDVKPNIFAKDPQVQVSIICPSPDFIAVEAEVYTGLTSAGDIWEDIDYVGTVPAGFVLKATRAVGTPSENPIQVMITGEQAPQTFIARGLISDSYRWEMSSVPGQKYVRSVNISLGTVTNYLNDVASDAIWPMLYPSQNKLSVVTTVVAQNWELSYFPRFGGL